MTVDSVNRTAPLTRHRALVALYATTTFTASALLFLVQPMFAKMALPLLGGSAAVWNTCVLFFQTALLLGYLYAHLSIRWLGARRQPLWHVGLMLVPLLALPLGIGTSAPAPGVSPRWWLLGVMAVRIGPTFLVVATLAPLVQRWFAALPLPSGKDPYFLYAASNLGSMLALLAYPFLIEPVSGVRFQAVAWASGYVVLLALAAGCAAAVYRLGSDTVPSREGAHADASIHGRERAMWVVWAFVPSSLMLGVTTHISTDLAAVPLLWVLPLVLYLASFVVTFSPAWTGGSRHAGRLLALLTLLTVASIALRLNSLVLIPVHLGAFFACALSCHGQLAARRPAAVHLTEFYLWLSFGGVLGGVFNTLIAPQVFNGIFEYPLVLLLGCVLRTPAARGSLEPWRFFAVTVTVPAVACAALWRLGIVAPALPLPIVLLVSAAASGAAWAFARRRAPFNAVIATLVALVLSGAAAPGDVLFAGRSFYGVLRVVRTPDRQSHLLVHGTTLHGRQDMRDPTACEPLAYFHRAGPIGQVLRDSSSRIDRMAVVGLGTGALACYVTDHQQLTFFEVDALVERVARDPHLFTSIENARGKVDVEIGDGRKKLEEARPGTYDLIVLDAFSSDSVPVHLLTREALRVYVTRLRDDGLIAFNITNRYLDLAPVLGAEALAEGLFAVVNLDDDIPADDRQSGRLPSHWVVMSPSEQSLRPLLALGGWHSLRPPAGTRQWTDDYSHLLGSLEWRTAVGRER